MGMEIQFEKMKVQEDDGDVCTAIRMHFMPLSSKLQNG